MTSTEGTLRHLPALRHLSRYTLSLTSALREVRARWSGEREPPAQARPDADVDEGSGERRPGAAAAHPGLGQGQARRLAPRPRPAMFDLNGRSHPETPQGERQAG